MASYARTTIATLKSNVKERLGGEGVFWTDSEIVGAINEAMAVWQLLTGDFVTTANQTVASNSQVLQLASTTVTSMGLVRVRRMTTTTTPAPSTVLYPVSIFEMDQGYYGRQGAASSSTPEYWAPFGIDKMIIYPAPNTTQTVQLQYYNGDPRISNTAGDYFNLGDEEVIAIVNYAVWACSFKEGVKEALINTSPLRDMFMAAARLRNQKLRATALYRDYMGNDRDETKPTRNATEQQGLRG